MNTDRKSSLHKRAEVGLGGAAGGGGLRRRDRAKREQERLVKSQELRSRSPEMGFVMLNSLSLFPFLPSLSLPVQHNGQSQGKGIEAFDLHF